MMLEIAGDLSGAAAALAGLILVFFGASISSFDSYDETQKGAVRGIYRRRAYPAFMALVAALLSCALGLIAKAHACIAAAILSAALLGVVGVAVLVLAVLALMEIG